jgi:hypothetical protein
MMQDEIKAIDALALLRGARFSNPFCALAAKSIYRPSEFLEKT